MQKEKFGFVYIWRDKFRKRFYIGCHWGHLDDGYVCSSNWMRMAYKRRPQDFKRRILSKIYTTRRHLLLEEQKWLDLIPRQEFGKKFYNLNKNVLHNAWWNDPTRAKTVGERISYKTKGRRLSPAGEIKKGEHRGISTEIKPGQRLSPITEFQKGQSTWNKCLSTPKEVRQKQSEAAIKRGRNSPATEFKPGFTPWNDGIPCRTETKQKLSELSKGQRRSPATEFQPKTHCTKGHEFTIDNTAIRKDKNGKEYKGCRQCTREKMRLRRSLLKAA